MVDPEMDAWLARVVQRIGQGSASGGRSASGRGSAAGPSLGRTAPGAHREPVRQAETRVRVHDSAGAFRAWAVGWVDDYMMDERSAAAVDRGSDLEALYAELREARLVGETILVRAHFERDERGRVTSVRVESPSLGEEIRVTGTPPQREEIRQVEEEIEQVLPEFEAQRERAEDLAQHAILEGSERYRTDETSREFQERMQRIEDLDPLLSGAPDPGERALDNYVESTARRELERRADQAIERARRTHDRLTGLHDRARKLHEALGERYAGRAPTYRSPLR